MELVTDSPLDVIVVGAGQAGLGIGYFLKQNGLRFMVLERGRIGETWRSQRWDSFAVNTPNWANGLPGLPYDGAAPDGFYLRDELVASFVRYAQHFDLPVERGVTVTGVAAGSNGTGFVVEAARRGSPRSYETRNVVIASGIMQTPNVPALSAKVPEGIVQLHTADYRSAGPLPPGAVVVVGGGQSGCQIAEDLLRAGREVYLCASQVGRIPRRYRGRDILEWWADMGFLDVTAGELDDPAVRFAAQPQVSGVGRYGHTVSLQQLAGDGVKVLGRLNAVTDGVLYTDDQLAAYARFADEKSASFKSAIDEYIARSGVEAAESEDDSADEPSAPGTWEDIPTRLDLAASGVAAMVWCTGFTADFSWIRLPVLDAAGRPEHDRGVATVPGVYFLGFPWLHSRKSGIILGIEEDSRHIASVIAGRVEAA
jgi:putative flavoprotein involved in K+ transport